jgi:transcriptional regulator with XRE-family HTH domain
MTAIRWENGTTKPDYTQAYQLASVLEVEFGVLFPPPEPVTEVTVGNITYAIPKSELGVLIDWMDENWERVY